MNRAQILTLLIALAAASCGQSAAPPAYRVAPDDRGVWSIIAPSGERFFSLGVNNISGAAWNPRPDTRYYDAIQRQFGGNAAAWSDATRSLLLSHGFNTLGAWSRKEIRAGEGLHRTLVLYVAGHVPDRCLVALEPNFESIVRDNVRIALADYPDRAALMGVFLDNEMPWWGRGAYQPSRNYTLLERALDLEAKSTARQAAIRFLKERHADAGALTSAWQIEPRGWDELSGEALSLSVNEAALRDRAAFTALVAERFFSISARVARETLPGALVLGVRHGGDAPDAVLIEEAKHCDVISLNDYNYAPDASFQHYARFWLLTQRPLMLTEFSWRATENASGNPNSRGAGPLVATQADRATRYAEYVRDLATIPVVVGAHWFEFADQSPQGRFDGEDSNYGIVDLENRPYETLLQAMKQTHAELPALRSATPRRMPNEIEKPQRPRYSPGQRPERPPTFDLLADWIAEPELWHADDAAIKWERVGSGLQLTHETGGAYGCGISFHGPRHAARGVGPAVTTDLDGYTHIAVDYSAPRGLQFNIVLAEAGSGPPGRSEYATAAGDDGEAFISESWFAAGGRQQIRIAIRDLNRQRFWGNQRGGNTIDMQAVLNIGLQLQGTPRSGVVELHALRLER